MPAKIQKTIYHLASKFWPKRNTSPGTTQQHMIFIGTCADSGTEFTGKWHRYKPKKVTQRTNIITLGDFLVQTNRKIIYSRLAIITKDIAKQIHQCCQTAISPSKEHVADVNTEIIPIRIEAITSLRKRWSATYARSH